MVELSLGNGGDIEPQVNFAGDTANTAIYLKREVPDTVEVAYVTVVGEDALSERIVRFLQAESLDTRLISRHRSRPPGLYAISVDESGERSFIYWRDNSAATTLFENSEPDKFDALRAFDMLYISGISLAILNVECREQLLDWIGDYRQGGGRVAFDSNYRPALWANQRQAQQTMARAWSLCDIALPSLDDEMALFGNTCEQQVLERLRSYGLQEGALKRGEDGPVPIRPGLAMEPLLAASKVVDTTAAGDSFNGAYLAARIRGDDELQAILCGHDCALRVIGVRGAIIPGV